ncbi:hypothetical protein JCM11251_006986 [Rhodosporidiobolus azoricus]
MYRLPEMPILSLITLVCLLPLVALASTHQPAQTGFVLARRDSLGAVHRRQASTTSSDAVSTSSLASASPAKPAAAGEGGTSSLAALAEGGTQLDAAEPAGQVNGSTAAPGGGGAADTALPANDPNLIVLQLAFVLENLESLFYKQALERFPAEKMVEAGLSEWQASVILEQVKVIEKDEDSHVKALEGAIVALGGSPFQSCNFNFDEALKDPAAFLATARVLEAVGQGAYLGAAHLLTDPQLLIAAGSILTLEARHQSLLNVFNGGSFAGQSFDIALTPQGVLANAGAFLRDCQASDLGLTANNPLTVITESGDALFKPGSKLAFESIVPLELAVLTCRMVVGGVPSALTFPAEECYVPQGIDGPVAVHLVNSTVPLASNIIIQNSAVIIAGPAFIFVDSKPSDLSSFFALSLSEGKGDVKGARHGGGSRDFEGEKGKESSKSELETGDEPALSGPHPSSPSHYRLARSPRSRRSVK